MPVTAFIGLGSNLDDPEAHVRRGIEDLARLPGTVIGRVSRLYRSAPVGYCDQPDFVNAVVELATQLDPRSLLDALLEIERRHGRERSVPNGPRTLDLDILLYGDQVVHERGLAIPHPRMRERAFVMVPLAEIAPHQSIPGAGSVVECLKAVDVASVAQIASARA
jgi:2-amino-4-hydroxy-6-hydroxymethyldihydropteridine diphosphokinase